MTEAPAREAMGYGPDERLQDSELQPMHRADQLTDIAR